MTEQETIYEVLGGDEVLARGGPAGDDRPEGAPVEVLFWHRLIRDAKLPWASMRSLKSNLGVANEALAGLLGVSPRTLTSRYKSAGNMRSQQADRAYRIAQAFAHAEAVFGSKEAARAWLTRPQPGLGEQVPLDLLVTEAGAGEVADLLGRIEYGVPA